MTQPSSKALRLAMADKGLRVGAKRQRGSGKGPRRGGHWLYPSHPMENPSLQKLSQVLCFPSQQLLFSSSFPGGRKKMLEDVVGALHLLQYLSIPDSC